jgi:hypothetical protein
MIYLDFCGIQGFHVVLDVISDDLERSLFLDPIFPHPLLPGRPSKRHGLAPFELKDVSHHPSIVDLIGVIGENMPFVIEDLPDYYLGLSYPVGCSGFAPHFDSTKRWGKYVIGISLGAGTVFSLLPAKQQSKPDLPKSDLYKVVDTEKGWVIHIYLPRGSIYVMSGDSRSKYRHSILASTKKRLSEVEKPSDWNVTGERRSITMRTYG